MRCRHLCHRAPRRCFNPRPPLLAGDAGQRRCGGARPGQFQSAPAIAGGRCRRRPPFRRAPWSFNPRPPLLAGDAFTRGFAAFTHTRFNPRPPLLAGDAKAANHMGRCGQVSIRARHCWRAMRRSCGWRSGVPSFNPRPPLLAGDAPLEFAQPICQFAFQSAPAIAGGRCHSRLVPAVVLVAFQSAPAIAGGRCLPRIHGNRLSIHVSIRARHCWRAMPVKEALIVAGIRVSIRARHCWRAMRKPPAESGSA